MAGAARLLDHRTKLGAVPRAGRAMIGDSRRTDDRKDKTAWGKRSSGSLGRSARRLSANPPSCVVRSLWPVLRAPMMQNITLHAHDLVAAAEREIETLPVAEAIKL